MSKWYKRKGIVLGLVVGLFSLFLLAGCASNRGNQGDKGTVTVSAAASMQGALNEIKDKYIAEKGLPADAIRINYAGSGTLREQIEQGVPSSIFISADERNMQKLVDKKLVSDVKPLVQNELVLIVPKGKTAYTLQNIKEAKRIAVGTPETVPAGQYTKEALTKLGLWSTVASHIVYGKDVKAVANYVAQGVVEAGFVYKTDALAIKDKVSITETVPANTHQAVVYPIALVTKQSDAASEEFYTYLFTPEAQAIFAKYGFTVVK